MCVRVCACAAFGDGHALGVEEIRECKGFTRVCVCVCVFVCARVRRLVTAMPWEWKR